MRRDVVLAVAAGVLGALLLVAAWHGSVLGVALGLLFSPLPLAMATLGLGLYVLPVAVVAGAATVMVLTGSAAGAAIYLLVDVVPVALLTRIGLEAEHRAVAGRDLGLAIVTLALVALALMMVGLALFPAGPDGIEAALRTWLQQQFTQAGAFRGVPEARGVTPAVMIDALASALPGAAAWNWSCRALVSTAIGQWLLARDGFARWPTPAYRTIAVPGWYIGVFLAVVVAASLLPATAGFLAATSAAVLSLPLVLQGLAVVHCAAAKLAFGRLALVVFYMMALIAIGASPLLVAVLGIVEHFVKLRARIAAAQDGGR
jgi:hypothetical protein